MMYAAQGLAGVGRIAILLIVVIVAILLIAVIIAILLIVVIIAILLIVVMISIILLIVIECTVQADMTSDDTTISVLDILVPKIPESRFRTKATQQRETCAV